MPTLPSLQVSDSGTQTYAPLSASSPIISHSKSIIPNTSSRSVSPASSASGGSGGLPAQLDIESAGANGFHPSSNGSRTHRGLRSDSEETLSPSLGRNGTIRAGDGQTRGKGKGKAVVDQRGHWTYATHDGQDQGQEAAGDVGGYGGARAREGERVQGVRFGGSQYAADGQEERGQMERKGSRSRQWDEEQGRVEEVYGSSGAYPPTNEEEEEERRIAENLARMAARDQARRRAARTSRMYPADSDPDLTDQAGQGSGFSASTSNRPRPTSAMGLGRSNSSAKGGAAGGRASFMGLGGLWKGDGAERGMERLDDEETLSRETSRQSYNNPYDPHPHLRPQPTMPIATPDSPPVPSRIMPQRQSSDAAKSSGGARIHAHTLDRSDPSYVLSPFADPDDLAGPTSPSGSSATLAATTSKSKAKSSFTSNGSYDRPVSRVFPGFPDYEEEQQRVRAATYESARMEMQMQFETDHVDDPGKGGSTHARTPSQLEAEQGQGFSYAGAGWKGGAGAGGYVPHHRQQSHLQAQQRSAGHRGKERWWHSLCAWGSDLDGGHGGDPDGQGGRTNPYE